MSDISKTILEKLEIIFRDNIVKQRWKMGKKIDFLKLQMKYNISRTPIRDALNRLVRFGLVVVSPRVGYYVREFNSKEINEIFEFRKILEISALKSSIKTIDKSKLKNLLQRLIMFKNDSSNINISIKEEFLFGENLHTLIMDNCENELMKNAYYNIYDYIKMLWDLNYPFDQDFISDHINILEALNNNDYFKSKKILMKHINYVKNKVMEK